MELALHRFRTSAKYYANGRLEYPRRLIERIIQLTALPRSGRVLDLGCGPAFLAAAFAPFCREAVGVDPEPAMLAEAEKYACQKNVSLTLRLGSSYDLDSCFSNFDLALMGRSFHWMDRQKTLETLFSLLSPDGAVVLFGDSHLKIPENRWTTRYEALLKPYAEKDSYSHCSNDPSWLSHEAVLLRSSFRALERFSVIERIQTPTERLVDRALSMSSTSPERLGDQLPTFIGELRQILQEESPRNGSITEVVEFDALIAFKR